MKHILIIVGEELHINESFFNYILDTYKKHFLQTPLIYYISDSDKELPFKIEAHAKEQEYITIVASENNFYTISRVLCTLSGDALELKENTLMPSGAEIFKENTFIIPLLESKINLIKAQPTKKLPDFLHEFENKPRIFHLLDIDKSSADLLLSPLSKTFNISFITTPLLERLIYVKAKSEKFGQMDAFIDSVKSSLAKQFIQASNIVEFVAQNLIKKSLSISFAESCTAGLAASKLGQISGVSAIFDGSLVTYSNKIKNLWLGVNSEVLDSFGAVSNECVEQMAMGARKMSGSHFGIAISGIAGPGGGSAEKPVGRVHIAVCNESKVASAAFDFSGDRDYIREQSAICAYAFLLKTFWDEIVL